MHLRKITFTNFRCFKHLEIELHPRLTVLVAENGAGKTAILDGIAIGLAPILRYLSSTHQRLSGPELENQDFLQIVHEGRSQIAADYVQVAVETASGLKWDVSASAFKSKHSQPPSKFGQSALNEHLTGILHCLNTMSPEPVPVMAYYGTRRGWFEGTGSSVTLVAELHESKIKQYYPTSALINSLNPFNDFKQILKWFDPSPPYREERPLNLPDLSIVGDAIESILNGEYKNPRFGQRYRFVLDSKNGTIEISQLSQGYQSMLAIGMDFARRLALANPQLFIKPNESEDEAIENETERSISDFVKKWNPNISMTDRGPAWAPAVMLVDEIDLHLHPSWQQRVLGNLMRTFPGTQFIVTTHSPQVLSTVEKASIRILKTVDGNTVLSTPQFQTRGVESAVVLAEIMGIDPVPQVEEAKWLNDYQALIDQGKNNGAEGSDLRAKLLDFYGEAHPIIRDCDRLIRFQSFKRK